MKKILLAATSIVLALSATSALAADLPTRKGPPPAYIPPPPLLTWQGFYVGLNAGYTWSDSNVTFASVPNTPPFFPDFGFASNALISGNSDGFIGGGQIGYNWQFTPQFVGGVEADIAGVAHSGKLNSVSAFPDPVAGQPPMLTAFGGNKSLDYIGTVRGRLGWLFTPTLLVYGTGGLAYGGANISASWFLLRPNLAPAFSPDVAASTFSDTRVGWTAGGGVEWMFAPNWSAKAEYLYYDLGSVVTPVALLVDTGNGNQLAFNRASTRFNGHIIRAGVNYHFNWGAAPVVAKY
jgi:outer membrane immunogenic protein